MFGYNWLVLKDALNEPVQTAAPVLRIMAVAIDVPDVVDFVLLQKLMRSLADVDQTIFVAAGEPQQFELFFCFGGIGNEFLRAFRVRRG